MTEVVDPYDARRAIRARGLLAAFNDAGVLVAADIHVATRLAALTDEPDETVQLAIALAVRGPRLGHTCVDLTTIETTATVDLDEQVDLSTLPWPQHPAWLEAVRRSPLVAVGEEGHEDRPLRLVDTTLYLDRYWREERQVAADLRALSAPAEGVDEQRLEDGLDRLFERHDEQREAAAEAVRRRLAVVGGGPGTGKTTTVARIVALLLEQSVERPPLIALAAPTGKASARLEEAVHAEAAALDIDEATRQRLAGLSASTLHRLLGWRPDSHSRFRHNATNRLPHDAVIVDETSMVSLSLMASLVQAVRPGARLILVGDPGQLTSIEAGAVLGDIVGNAATPGIVVLERVHRYGGDIARVADAIRAGDPDATIAALDGVTWIDADPAEVEPPEVRHAAIEANRALIDAAQAGDVDGALQALTAFRLLCAHRRGPHGALHWMSRVEGWLDQGIGHFAADGEWYVGRPLLVTRNDYALRLYNGDTGVIVQTGPDERAAAFDRGTIRPSRLEAVETVHAMTIHKSQGSQFDTAAVLLPPVGSRLLTRELLYTAVTRARQRLILVGTEESVRAAVERPVARASGLGRRLRLTD
jgi:exodeoxyribonuclease V alpha subunit